MVQKLLTSRRLWTFVLSQLAVIGLFTASTYLVDPNQLRLAQMVIGFVEGTGIIVVSAYTIDDVTSNVSAIRAGTHPDYPPTLKSE